MQIYWNKIKCLHKKRVQLPEDWYGTPIWPPWRHVKTLYSSNCCKLIKYEVTFCSEKFGIIRPRVQINLFTLSSHFLFFNHIANYKYCCRGLYCPGCPNRLYLRFGEQRILVHNDLPMDCQERHFNTSLDTFQQEGTYQINVSSFNFSYLLCS